MYSNALKRGDIILSMTLTLAEVEHIAELARLRLTPEEMERYREQLSAILDYFVQLQDLDTDDIPPTSSVLPGRSVLRADEAKPGLSIDEILRNAPESKNRQFRIPPVLD
jgi:aspartyl-tRNA(Asn)/glutamyl-tRNA(Gln) amidotransferase subunit C